LCLPLLSLQLISVGSASTRSLAAPVAPTLPPAVSEEIAIAAIDVCVSKSSKCRCDFYKDYDLNNDGKLEDNEVTRMVRAAGIKLFGPGVITAWKESGILHAVVFAGINGDIPKFSKAEKGECNQTPNIFNLSHVITRRYFTLRLRAVSLSFFTDPHFMMLDGT
jgi:hypothetical protein